MSEDQNTNVLTAERAVSTTPGPTTAPVAPSGPGIPLPVPFRPATYSFTIENMKILDTRSLHDDSDKASVSVAVGAGTPTTVAKDLGDVNNGTHPINLQVGPVDVRDPNVGIAFNYLIVNAGHSDWATIDEALAKAGNTLAADGAKAATAAIGEAVGASVGGTVLPIIGSVLGLAFGWLADQLINIILADCDGPVAAEQPAFKGIDLWRMTHVPGGSFQHTTYHPGSNSPVGCGGNSRYYVTWKVTRMSTEPPPAHL